MALYIGRSSAIVLKTLPYVFMRLAVYTLVGIGFCLYFLLVYVLGQGLAHLHELARVILWIVALAASFKFVQLIREYVLYLIKAGHVAVIAELASKGSLPEGVGQIEWGKAKVMKTFKETSVLFVVDRLVMGVIRSVNGMMSRLGNMFSAVPGMEGMVRFANTILRFSLTYIDEAILARNFLREKESVWESARSGIILYAQTWKEILKTAMILSFVSIISYTVLFIILLIPFLGMGAAFPHYKWFFILAAFACAAIIKLALLDPWSLTHMILVYLQETEGKIPDPAWEEKLEAVSSKFKQIQTKALETVAPSTSSSSR